MSLARSIEEDRRNTAIVEHALAPIDVLITCHNERDYIGDALKSVAGQTAQELIREIIIVDDGSTDGSGELLDGLARHCAKVKVYHIANRGLAGARNYGLGKCSAPFVALLDGDDLWHASKLETQWRSIAKSPRRCAIWYTDYLEFEAAREPAAAVFPRRFSAGDDDFLTRYFVYDAPIIPSSVVLRRSSLASVGGFNEEVKLFEDMELWLRLARKFTAQHVPGTLLMKRRRGNALSANLDGWEEAMDHIANLAIAAEPALKRLLNRRKAYRLAKLGYGLTMAGRGPDAARVLWRSLKLKPLSPRALLYLAMLTLPRSLRPAVMRSVKRGAQSWRAQGGPGPPKQQIESEGKAARAAARRPKVLYFLNSFERGGAELGLLKLVRGGLFADCDLGVVAIARGHDSLIDELCRLGHPPTFLIQREKMRLADMPAALLRFRHLLLRREPDVLILSLPQANLIGRLCALWSRTPTVISFEHNTHLSNVLYELLYWATSSAVGWMFADCEHTARVAMKRLYRRAPPKHSIVPLVAFGEAPATTACMRKAGRPFHVINAGRLTPAKNQIALIEAVALLAEQGIDVRLTLYGEGPCRALCERLVRSRGLERRIRFRGFVRDWWRERPADLLVIASKTEGQCLAALEAMHAGIPVLAAKVGGLADLSERGVVLTLPDTLPRTIAERIAKAARHPEDLARYAKAGRRYVGASFGTDAVKRAYRELNEALLACAS